LTVTNIVVYDSRHERWSEETTNAELAILQVLWARGPSTVREVAEVMDREGAYTTVLKLQIMTEKRLVRRDESAQAHVYEAAYSEVHTQQQIVADLVARAFDGSAGKLGLQPLASGKASPEELAEIRKLIDKQRGGRP
jgi:BlaI family transcriptional regulator, penicillinase repressor